MASASPRSTAIFGATVIDGNGGAPIQNGVIVMQQDRIVAIGPRDTPIPAHAARIEARGKFIIPGLMDANVHLVYGFSTEYLIRFEEEFAAIIREAAQVAVKSGVTTLFDTWGPMEPLLSVRDEIREGKLQASRIFVGGNIVGLDGPFSADFYASAAGISDDTAKRINEMYERGSGHELIYMAPDQVRKTIRRYLGNDIDFLKYAVSGHADRELGFILFSPEVQRVLVEEGHRHGLIVQTHTTSVESLRMAVDAGVDLLQHCNITVREMIPDDLLREIVERKIPCAMQIYPKRYLRSALGDNFGADPQTIRDPRQRSQAVAASNQRRLIASGAFIVMMTDGGVPYQNDTLLQKVFFQHCYPEIRDDIVGFFGHGHAAWLRGAVEAGLSPMEALQAATKNVAVAYGKLADFGTLERGKVADLVILNADPLADPANYTAIDHVIKAGQIVNVQQLPTTRVLTSAHGNSWADEVVCGREQARP